MANLAPPPSEPSLPELPEDAEDPEQADAAGADDERPSEPPPAPAADRKLTPAEAKLRATSSRALMDPKVQRVMAAIVRDLGVRGSQAEDMVADIREDVWNAFDAKCDWPQDAGRWIAILREATKYKVFDIFRKRAVRSDFNAKVEDTKLEQVAIPPSSHRDRDDVREKASLIGQVQMPLEQGAAILDAKMAGKSVSAAAREVGMTATQGHDLWKSIQSQFRGAYQHRYGKAALAAAVLGGGAWVALVSIGQLADPGGTSDSVANIADTPRLRQDATRLAADALAAADAECDAGQWGQCQDDAARAREYDVDGNLAPQIAQLTQTANDGLLATANAKAGMGKAPKGPKAPPKGK